MSSRLMTQWYSSNPSRNDMLCYHRCNRTAAFSSFVIIAFHDAAVEEKHRMRRASRHLFSLGVDVARVNRSSLQHVHSRKLGDGHISAVSVRYPSTT